MMILQYNSRIQHLTKKSIESNRLPSSLVRPVNNGKTNNNVDLFESYTPSPSQIKEAIWTLAQLSAM